jgi:hypothetical protein
MSRKKRMYMTDDRTPDEKLPDGVRNTLERSGIKLGAKKQEEAGPRYKMVGDTKIFVSSVTGDLWKSRYDAAVEDRKPYLEAWSEAIKYYHNDQLSTDVQLVQQIEQATHQLLNVSPARLQKQRISWRLISGRWFPLYMQRTLK